MNCDPETFDLECELLNQEYNKNNTYDEIKSHHYIISHDPKDNTDHNLTGEWAQAIGMEYPSNQFSKSPKNKNSQRIMWFIPHNTLAI